MLSIIVALGKNNEIGNNNKIPWHISEDLKRFKNLTNRKTIIMGRKTFNSLPKFLDGRNHIIISTKHDCILNKDICNKNAKIETNLAEVLEYYKKQHEESFIIGGETIYQQSLSFVDKLYLTMINKSFDADTFFPNINYDDWVKLENSSVRKDEKSNLEFSYVILQRKNKIT